MALRHYGGSKPAEATEWVCPSCHHVNSTPLKAGCQSCHAGGDAKKVAAPAPEPMTVVTPEIPVPAAILAFERWTGERTTSETNWQLVREAFMAGVAWAQGQPARGGSYDRVAPEVPLNTPNPDWDDPKRHVTLWLDDGKHQDPLDPPTLETILAALAFYRENVLGYGAVPGQLSAEQVGELITRLSPQEPQV